MCAVAVQGSFHSARIYVHKCPDDMRGRERRGASERMAGRREGTLADRKRGERKKDRAITPACTRLILICILIAATIIDGSDFSGKPRQSWGEKKSHSRVSGQTFYVHRVHGDRWNHFGGLCAHDEESCERAKFWIDAIGQTEERGLLTFDRRYDFMRSFCTAAIKLHN